ncbi:YgiW/YdeI family stress tolerance OB fold protein [Avibacterium paragallinarum]|uniref:Uncharacterized conserved protein n=1 Tax=Avibacterium paragallinarum TaxID=728 RepID=A0A0F5EXA3_AVIPA|nr:NirD/YgiW/YdeI family stress tolerance protein [Avibacterium paragallinarum]KAA6208043.1 NirD/YgiW/YdeI family stress tolerance protein [Avibacterium paragallinarum]KKB00562.1 hypothetical protein Z012_11400 [Avibacterium paragallinarum]RZN68387.1 NirD/YgiW/YdeI family stress tolerance protein [Avibacterium paragallinarum]SUU97135.1 Uncharacterized conserved protein [Avibacterium paragallinarum]
MKKFSLATILLLSMASFAANAENSVAQTTENSPTIQKGEKHQGKHHHKKSRGERMRGGFVDPSNPQTQKKAMPSFDANQLASLISQKGEWKDDQQVVLQGKIVKQLSKNDFLFRDNSGETEIEVKHRAWKGQIIKPNDEVRIFAEVDKSDNKLELEVHHIVKIQGEN